MTTHFLFNLRGGFLEIVSEFSAGIRDFDGLLVENGTFYTALL